MKKILLFIGMFLITLNVKALTFNVDLTNIEDKGNNGTIGQITNIDIPNKTIDAYFQDIGDEVNFELTITNSGNRAGTLKSITVTSTSESIEYTNNLPEGGLSINGNDYNTVTITAKVKEGAVNGTSSSEITIKYNYDEGSCPEGEILSEDESMCLCPTGKVRNEQGVCIDPPKDKDPECEDDEIYNETKKICEKKVVPTPEKEKTIPIINPSNPKTMDNIILITLLFFVSGLGIYAVLFKKLKTTKKKVVVGIITGVTTLALSFTVLAGVFGLDNLLSAIVNPITKSKEVVVTVNEEIDLIETWDGECSLGDANLTPQKIFEGGSGTKADPYQIKTAEQLSCFAKSINNGTTYEGKYIKQTKNIKLNDNLNDNIEAGTTDGLNVWISAGYYNNAVSPADVKTFNGTYDGDNHIISGVYITDDSTYVTGAAYRGLFGCIDNATFKNMIISDVYANTSALFGLLGGASYNNLTIDNVTTYGNVYAGYSAGLISYHDSKQVGIVRIENTTNNINLTATNNSISGIIHRINNAAPSTSGEPTVIFRNDVNNGNRNATGYGAATGGIVGAVWSSFSGNSYVGYVIIENCSNTGEWNFGTGTQHSGVAGEIQPKLLVKNTYNTGNSLNEGSGYIGGVVGRASYPTTIENAYNSGNIIGTVSYPSGITEDDAKNINPNCDVAGILGGASMATIRNSYNTGNINGLYGYAAGIVGMMEGMVYGTPDRSSVIENCYNTGDITGLRYTGGLVAYYIGNVNKCYNTGKVTVFGGTAAGGLVGYQAVNVYNSYNTGELYVPAMYGNLIGGLCSQCNEIKNSYNRGNVRSKYTAQIAGLATNTNIIENSYNSGDIIFEGEVGGANTVMIGGISYNGANGNNASLKNNYNLGNIEINFESFNPGTVNIAGLNLSFSGVPSVNSVNKGNITVTRDGTINSMANIAGISVSGANNCFNAGTITVPEFSNTKKVGQILTENDGSSTGNKFNTDPNGFAIGCIGLPYYDSCTVEASNAVGTYTTEDAPDILSIINGDNAYNDELDEDGLPTLRAFNE